MFVICKGKKPSRLNFICDHVNVSAGHTSARATRSCAEDRKPTGKTRVVKDVSRRFNVWQVSRAGNGTGHPAIFPEQLAADHIRSWSNEGDIVLDPFMGSGTTAKVARALNRHYIGFEISAEYCDIIRKRLEQNKTLFDL